MKPKFMLSCELFSINIACIYLGNKPKGCGFKIVQNWWVHVSACMSLTPCPRALVKPPSALRLVLKNWWVKCWAMKANIRLVPWGSGRNFCLLKNLSVNSFTSGRTGFPAEGQTNEGRLQSRWTRANLTFSPHRQRTVCRNWREEPGVVGGVVVRLPAQVSVLGVVGRGAWNKITSDWNRWRVRT